MRQLRTYGSVRGAGGNLRPYRNPCWYRPCWISWVSLVIVRATHMGVCGGSPLRGGEVDIAGVFLFSHPYSFGASREIVNTL